MSTRKTILLYSMISIQLLALTACGGSPSEPAGILETDPAKPEAAVETEVEAPEDDAEPEGEQDPAQTAEDASALPEEEPAARFEIFNPYGGLTQDDIAFLNADGFTGTDKQIADAILAWQSGNMFYIGDPNQKPDISYPMRWNYMLPGIFPVSDMIHERRLENGMIYGLCWDYASIFSAIANYYGLDVRITANKVYISEQNPNIDSSTANGMSREEYDALQPRLEANGLNLDYNQISRAARETWAHYRAEVRIGEEWIAYDGVPGVAAGPTYEVAPWDEGYNADLLYAEYEYGSEGLDLTAVAAALAGAPAVGYQGLTDDAGDPHRAASLEDLIAGKGFAPYLTSMDAVLAFLHIGQAYDDIDEYIELMSEYEVETGKHFYVIADMMIYTEDDMAAEDYVPLYNALTGSDMTIEEFETCVQ
ncbi:MAG: transglutaminase family protein [Anaerolineales bacterium]|nr:transglutaminase family protein [Anaerolineales bacterium]